MPVHRLSGSNEHDFLKKRLGATTVFASPFQPVSADFPAFLATVSSRAVRVKAALPFDRHDDAPETLAEANADCVKECATTEDDQSDLVASAEDRSESAETGNHARKSSIR